jgi:hypothetical protein
VGVQSCVGYGTAIGGPRVGTYKRQARCGRRAPLKSSPTSGRIDLRVVTDSGGGGAEVRLGECPFLVPHGKLASSACRLIAFQSMPTFRIGLRAKSRVSHQRPLVWRKRPTFAGAGAPWESSFRFWGRSAEAMGETPSRLAQTLGKERPFLARNAIAWCCSEAVAFALRRLELDSHCGGKHAGDAQPRGFYRHSL